MKVTCWFTLYLVPIIPLGQRGRYVECTACAGTFSETTFSANAPSANAFLSSPNANMQSSAGEPAKNPGNSPFHSFADTSGPISVYSILSLILALLIPVSCLLPFSWIPISIASVVTGHFALSQIKSSGQKIKGKGVAIAGIVLGYTFMAAVLTLTIALIGIRRSLPDRQTMERMAKAAAVRPDSLDKRLTDAELSLNRTAALLGPRCTGNSDDANKLAYRYSEALKKSRDSYISKQKSPLFNASADQFLVYCELNPKRCMFLVDVPAYANFTEEAKELMKEIAWEVANQVAMESLDKDCELAIGMIGNSKYASVMVGHVDLEKPPKTKSGNKQLLLPFLADAESYVKTSPQEVPPSPISNKEPNAAKTSAPVVSQASPKQRQLPNESESALSPSMLSGADKSRLDAEKLAEANEKLKATLEATREAARNAARDREAARKAATEAITARAAAARKEAEASNASLSASGLSMDPDISRKNNRSAGWSPVKRSTQDEAFDERMREVRVTSNNQPISTNELIHEFPQQKAVRALAFSSDSKWLAVARQDESISIYDLESKIELDRIKVEGDIQMISALAFANDAKTLFVGGNLGAIRGFELDDEGKVVDASPTWKAHNHDVLNIIVAEKGTIVSSGADSNVTIRKDADSKPVSVAASMSRPISGLQWSKSRREVFASDGKECVLIDLLSAKIKNSKTLAGDSFGEKAAISSNGEYISTISLNKAFIQRLNKPNGINLPLEKSDFPRTIRFTPDGKKILVGSSGVITIFNSANGKNLSKLTLGDSTSIDTIAIAPDGKSVAAIMNSTNQGLFLFKIPK